jgi:hypothetical protein
MDTVIHYKPDLRQMLYFIINYGWEQAREPSPSRKKKKKKKKTKKTLLYKRNLTGI